MAHSKKMSQGMVTAHLSSVLTHSVQRRWGGVRGFPGVLHREGGTRNLWAFAKECLL